MHGSRNHVLPLVGLPGVGGYVFVIFHSPCFVLHCGCAVCVQPHILYVHNLHINFVLHIVWYILHSSTVKIKKVVT